MAAFGVPQAHEDDAERAVRAAFDVLEEVDDLGLQARAGVESGEVVVDDGDSTFATGEAVVVAARLQQSAPAGTITLGPGARRLTVGAVDVEDAGAVEIRPGETVWSWHATRVLQARQRRPQAQFVGREPELELLRNAYERTLRDRRPHLTTVFGDPGVGKSRLISEFAEDIERATVLTGRALPYGEGITYWPIASMVKASAGITDDDPAAEAFEKLRLSCESDAVAELLGVALGLLGAAEGLGEDAEIAWATLRWAEELADAQPLVLVFEDIQWADERLLEVVENLARARREIPLLIVCVARFELLDSRPAWGGGNPRAVSIELVPLDAEESDLLAAELLPAAAGTEELALLLEKAEGNPLFLEETARMLVEADLDCAALDRIPDSIQALIAARIDLLEAAQKRLLQRAAVIGRVFWRGALEHLAPGVDVAAGLEALIERDLIVRGRPLDDLGRPRVPVHARAHPRRRLRGAHEGRARRDAPAFRRLGAGRARRGQRIPPRPRLRAARRARRQPAARARHRGGGGARGGRAARLRRRTRSRKRAGCCGVRSSWSRRRGACTSLLTPRASSATWARSHRDGAGARAGGARRATRASKAVR